MRARWFFWWAANVLWAVLFSIGTVFVWTREVDGAGAVQTPEIKLISFLVLAAAFLIPAIMQACWLLINLLSDRRRIN